MNDWQKKLVKAGDKDQQVIELREKITELTEKEKTFDEEKGELTRQLKEKKDEWINHRCNTSNNEELNQTKDELGKSLQEISDLKEQLSTPSNNNSGTYLLVLSILLFLGSAGFFLAKKKKH